MYINWITFKNTRDKNIIVNHAARKLLLKVVGNIKKVFFLGGGGISWSRDGACGSQLTAHLIWSAPRNNQEQNGWGKGGVLTAPPKPPAANFGSLRSPHIHKHRTLKCTPIKTLFREYTQIIPGYAPVKSIQMVVILYFKNIIYWISPLRMQSSGVDWGCRSNL